MQRKENHDATVYGTTTEHGDLKILHASTFHTAKNTGKESRNKKGKEEKSMYSIIYY